MTINVRCCSQVDDVGGRQYTYWQLVQHVRNCASSLSELGLQPGQRVCLLLSNCIELPVAFLAILRLRAICVPFNPAATKCKPTQDKTMVRNGCRHKCLYKKLSAYHCLPIVLVR